MWPATHAEYTKRALDLVLLEKVRGTTFRRKMMAEHDLGVKLKNRKLVVKLLKNENEKCLAVKLLEWLPVTLYYSCFYSDVKLHL